MSKKIIITGAGGFLGGHLVHYFISQGMQVIAVLHKEDNEGSVYEAKRKTQQNELLSRVKAENQDYITFFEGDITSPEDMTRLFNETKPDALVHAAALLIPPKESDYADRGQYVSDNARFIEINQATILADCAAEYQKRNSTLYCLLISTIYVFNLKEPVINEDTPHLPINEYAQSKDAAQKYWESLGLTLAVIYPPQIYGSYQFTPAIMPKLIRKMLFNEANQLTLNGAINPIHVSNMTKLIYSLCLASAKGCFCVNGDGILTLEDIAHSLQKAASNFLAQYNKTPYSAFLVSSTNVSNTPKIDDTRLSRFFKSMYPEDNPHKHIPFTDTAQEMVAASWNHWAL